MGSGLGVDLKSARGVLGAVLALGMVSVHAARAQDQSLVLPPIDVTASRLGEGITGTSTSVITAKDIENSPAQNLPDILARSAGIQVMHLIAGPTGTQDLVDLRGFGAFAQSNVLVLVNGRRYQDFDLQGFDFSSIPLNSIARVEITRGNSGAVLYGDGAVGGVINIVTKEAAAQPAAGRVEGLIGSYGYEEGRLSAANSFGPWSVSTYANAIAAAGYRRNSTLVQQDVVSNLNYKGLGWNAYVNVGADSQHQGFPAGLPNEPLVYPITLSDPRNSVTPFDWGSKKDLNITAGVTDTLAPGIDFILDGGVRRKFQRSEFFSYFNPPAFNYDPSSAVPANYLNTGMTTTSLTPRFDVTNQLFGVKNHLLAGVDLYNTDYASDRYQAPWASTPIHRYDISQTTAAVYGMNTTSVLPDLDISVGGRLQRNMVKATDTYNASVDPNAGFYTVNPQAPALDNAEWQYAAHVGAEYRATSALTLFARAARAFRLPNADERVGAGNPYGVMPVSMDLKTQTSWDAEGGFRLHWDRFNFESSVYQMELKDEIHFIPALFMDVNLDPTERRGWENSASLQLTDALRLRGALAYTRAVFREGPFAGKQVPLVSRWSGNAGLTWDIVRKLLVLDATVRFWSDRRMDNDQANVQPVIPANATVDLQLGGEYGRLTWSVVAQNLLDVDYFDYAIASATTAGYYTGYPQPGRTFLARLGVKLP
jgi:iron complex outermembrane recepter protein